ncbi:MAG TPA: DMT family transporter [Mobilitalea sp.]|nr:DMT family transporter [Mobilitalea sp.]
MKMTRQEKIFTKPINVLLLSLVCTILWGSAFPSIKIGYQLFGLATNDVSGKLVFAGLRFFIAGLLVILINSLQVKKLIMPEKTNIKGVLIVSFFQTILEYIFFYISMSHTTGVKGAIIDASGFFFVVILAHFFYKNDRFTLYKSTGCILGFLGIILVNIKGLSTADFSFNFLGDGFMLFAALFFAIGSLISKNVCVKAEATMVTGYQLGFGGFVLMILGLATGGTLKMITLPGILLLLYMAALSAISFTLWTILSKYNKISKIAVYNFLTPVFGTLLSSLFLGENLLTWYNLMALILVCLGIYIVNLVKKETVKN